MNDFLKVVLNKDDTLSLIIENEVLMKATNKCGDEAYAILDELIEHITIKTNDIVLASMKVDVKSE